MATEKIYQLIYLSKAAQAFSDKELVALLEIAKINNVSDNLTGFLLYHENNFIQLLEGSRDKVEALFKILQQDKRHKNVIRLFSGYAEKRDFPEWSMGFKSIDKSALSVMEHAGLLLEAGSLADEELQKYSLHVRLFVQAFRDDSRVGQVIVP